MPIYVYRCECGLGFEQLGSFDADAPDCPDCGGATRKVQPGFSLGGRADAGLATEQMPQTWRGVHHGDRDYVTGMRRRWDRRRQLEARHPEPAGDQRPILAHEGRYHGAPLRAGDSILGAGAGSAGAGSGAAGHGHAHGAGSKEERAAARSKASTSAAPKPAGTQSAGPKPGATTGPR